MQCEWESGGGGGWGPMTDTLERQGLEVLESQVRGLVFVLWDGPQPPDSDYSRSTYILSVLYMG